MPNQPIGGLSLCVRLGWMGFVQPVASLNSLPRLSQRAAVRAFQGGQRGEEGGASGLDTKHR